MLLKLLTSVGLSTRRASQVHDDYDFLKARVRELENSNDFVRRNTLLSAIRKIEWVKEERAELGYNVEDFAFVIEILKGMLGKR